MISKELFEEIKKKYGNVASWAVWYDEGQKPMTNMGIDIFNINKNPSLLETLNNNVIMVGLNVSMRISEKPFVNFHTDDPTKSAGPVYKVRHAFKRTKYYGAYMTDIIKNCEMVAQGEVLAFLKNNPEIIKANISVFRNELLYIQAKKPLILAFGNATYYILNNYLDKDCYSKLIKIAHYSCYINKKDYWDKVHFQISQVLPL